MKQNTRRLLGCLRGAFLLILSVAIVAGGIGMSYYYMTNRPKPQRQAPPQTAALVEVQEIHAQSRPIIVPVMGTVIPAVEVTLQARVTGEVIKMHPQFIEGGIVRAGEVLVRLEPTDYELAIVSQEAQLEAARYEITVEQGQQDVAQREWDLLDMKDDASELDRQLALRQPQLRQKQAALRAAEASLEMARLDLERTVIKAPCNGIIRLADVDQGDQATPQTVLGTLVGTDAYWVQVSIPVDELKWVELPRKPNTGHTGSAGIRAGSADASAKARIYTGGEAIREGCVISRLGGLEPNGRLAQLLIEVVDPLDLRSEDEAQPLLLGEYVRVDIIGRTVDNVFAVPRDALRDGDKLWLASTEDTLDEKEAEIVWTDSQHALLRGLTEGDRIIVSDIAAPVPGMAIQVQGDAAVSAEAEPASTLEQDRNARKEPS